MERLLVGKSQDFRDGGMKMVRAGKKEILVTRLDGKFFAIDGWCSHMQASLEQGQIVDRTIRCRMHGAVFDLETGKVLKNNQAKDLRTYPVTIEGDEVYLLYEAQQKNP